MSRDDGHGNMRAFPTTSDRADELLRARTRQGSPPVPVPHHNAHACPAGPGDTTAPPRHVGYPVPPRRRVRPVSPQLSARQLACRDWLITGLVLGFLGGALCTALFVWTVLLFG